ncbi:MAG: hypothetical protein H6R26_3191 [Proteobacteria bacterium]|nr:hypothetical protein [Pseudomonadota bacterium]
MSQHVGSSDFLFPRRLHVEGRALQHSLEPQRGLRVPLYSRRNERRGFVQELLELLAQYVEVAAAGSEYLDGGSVVEHRQQQMFHGDEFMTLFVCGAKGDVERVFKFFA